MSGTALLTAMLDSVSLRLRLARESASSDEVEGCGGARTKVSGRVGEA